MTSGSARRRLPVLRWICQAALLLYPAAFRRRFGAEMVELFLTRHREARDCGALARAAFWARSVLDLVSSAAAARRGAVVPSPGRRGFEMAWFARDAARFVRRAPAASAAIVALMSLAIGATTATFSLVHATLLRPLPFGDPDRIVAIWEHRPDRATPRNAVSGHEFPEWQARARVFEGMAAVSYAGATGTLTGVGEPASLWGAKVTADFFRVMGVTPMLGRTFLAEEDAPGRGQVLVLSHRVWIDRYGGSRDAVGRIAVLDGRPFEIVGVMGPTFQFPRVPTGHAVDYWVPVAERLGSMRGRHFLTVVGRLKPFVTVEQAEADMARVTRDLATELPDLNRGHEARVAGLQDDLVRETRSALWLVFGAVGSLLLIGCANVAGLLVASGLGRRPEIAVRLALGATRWQVARQFLAESVGLSFLGAALGVGGAYWLVDVLPAVVPHDVLAVGDARIDAVVLAFAAAVGIGTGILFGLAPAMLSRRTRVAGALSHAGRSVGSGQSRLRNGLVAAQVALTLVLVSSTVVLTRGIAALRDVDPGFDLQGLVAVDLRLPSAQFGDPTRQKAFLRDAMNRIERLPGVVSAAATNFAPLGVGYSNVVVEIEGQPTVPVEDRTARYRVVTRDYFKVLGIRLLRGRPFDDRDDRLAVPLIRWFPQQPLPRHADAPQPIPVVAINEAMARRFWTGTDPIGRRIRVLFGPPTTVVGVVDSVRTRSLREPPLPEFYLSDLQEPLSDLSVLVRSHGDPMDLAPSLRGAIREVDPDLAIASIRTIETLADEAFAVPRFASTVIGAFAAAALLLMAAGVAAVVWFSTSLRMREIAMRVALGARRHQVARLVAGQALRLGLAGLSLGAIIGVPVSRLLGLELLGEWQFDLVTWMAAALAIVAAIAVACAGPVRRAASIDPAVVLRQER
jgi:putative ABC transport system permease protein